jgi:1-acyl-sn-glycerol-3-phosphate acyltransferase
MVILRVIRTAIGWFIGVTATVVFTLLGLVIALIPGLELLQHRMARLWGQICIWGAFCPIRVENLDRIDRRAQFVLMVNHQSALDIPLLKAVIPAEWLTVFWAKQSLFRIPVLGWAMRSLGHMPIDRINRGTAGRMLSDSISRAGSRRSLLVFPEETYSRDGKLLSFQRGGFVLAIKTGLPILPVGIVGTREALPPDGRLITPATLRVRFGEPIGTTNLSITNRQQLSDQTRDAIAGLIQEANVPPGR